MTPGGARPKICIVSSFGGHLMEGTLIAEGLRDAYDIFFITEGDLPVEGKEKTYHVRHVVRRPLSILVAIGQIFRILLKERPRAIISTGAETALPVFYLGKFLFRLPTVYIECSAQVVHPSRTGRLIYPVTDLFLVQWETLLPHYGRRARYRRGFL